MKAYRKAMWHIKNSQLKLYMQNTLWDTNIKDTKVILSVFYREH